MRAKPAQLPDPQDQGRHAARPGDRARDPRRDAMRTLRVDANAAWTPKQADRDTSTRWRPTASNSSSSPSPPAIWRACASCASTSPLPIFADESCVTADDVARLAGVVDGINIKLMKCGGICAGAAR